MLCEPVRSGRTRRLTAVRAPVIWVVQAAMGRLFRGTECHARRLTYRLAHRLAGPIGAYTSSALHRPSVHSTN